MFVYYSLLKYTKIFLSELNLFCLFEITRALPDEVDCIEGVIGISAKGALQEIPAVVTEKENGELQVGQYILPLSDRSYHRPVSDGFFFHRPLSDGSYIPSSSVRWIFLPSSSVRWIFLPSSSVRWKISSIVQCQMDFSSIVHCQMEDTFHRPVSDGSYIPSSSVRWKLHSIVHCQMEVTFHLPSSIFHLPSSSSETIHEKVKQNHLIDEQNSITCFRIKIFAQFFQMSAI